MSIEVKIATSEEELNQGYHIRYKVFIEELQFALKEGYPDKLEKDEYDFLDTTVHFIAKVDEEAVGTARLIKPNREMTENNQIFGLPMEDLFDLSRYKKMEFTPLEVSRSSIIKNKRSSIIILDIWKICINYCIENYIPLICSCAGTETDNYEDVQIIYNLLKLKKLLHPSIYTKPLSGVKINHSPKYVLYDDKIKKELLTRKNFNHCTLEDYESLGIKLPVTLDYYSRIGVKFTGPPALFPEFNMYTLPMILEFEHINEPFKTFFKRKSDHVNLKIA